MNEHLKSELRALGLLPVRFDEVAQARFRAVGIDPNVLESHYTPGTREDILNRQKSIDAKVMTLAQMESQGLSSGSEYDSVVLQIQQDMDYITAERARGFIRGWKKAAYVIPISSADEVVEIIRRIAGGIEPLTTTDVAGVNRDIKYYA